jgi:23S rRNA (uridine2552-2'-O)-methyltransferase
MSKRWFREKKREHYYKLAKKQNYRSRAAYKLKQIQDRFNVIHYNFYVVDLGASPGGWSQVAAEIAGTRGKVVAIDRARMKPIEQVTVLRGDMLREETIAALFKELDGRKADVVISDMSPDISGNYSIDHARSIELCETALEFARKALRPGGNLVVKVFMGDLFGTFIAAVRQNFRNVHAYHPDASRPSSSEIYIVAKGLGMEWTGDRLMGKGRVKDDDRVQGKGSRAAKDRPGRSSTVQRDERVPGSGDRVPGKKDQVRGKNEEE